MENKTFAVTGATGNIGSVLAETLLSRGYQVRAIGRSKDRLQSLVEKGAEPCVGSIDDADFLNRAFRVDAVFTMIPPNATAENFRAYQNQIGEALAVAIKNAGVTEAVNLSSIAGHLAEGTGPIKGLHDNEERLNGLDNVNVVHLRPGHDRFCQKSSIRLYQMRPPASLGLDFIAQKCNDSFAPTNSGR